MTLRWSCLWLVGCTAAPLSGAPQLLSEEIKWVNPAEAEDLNPEEGAVRIELEAATQIYVIDGVDVSGYAYNRQNPGPTIRLQRGDHLEVELTNTLDVETTIHWHGLHVPYEMDGVTWTQDPIAPGETFTYAFTVNQVGTYWYHPHFDTERQVDLGLYGLIIVEDPAAPEPDHEVNIVFDAWGEWQPGDVHDHQSHIDNWTLNGLLSPSLAVDEGDVVHMRLLNASNVGYLDLSGAFEQIGSDQGWLPTPQSPASLVLTPGDRAELSWSVGADALQLTHQPYALHGGPTYGASQTLFSFEVSPNGAGKTHLEWPTLGLPQSPDSLQVDLTYVFQGDDSSGTWMINGEIFPEVTVEQLALDSTATIELRNISAAEHPFHLHGHAFEVLSVNDVVPTYTRIEDTINLKIRDRIRIRLLADNPGYWMTHCHILPHAHGGMMTVLQVGDTP